MNKLDPSTRKKRYPMTKNLLLLALAALPIGASAQVFSEDFQNGIPASFTVIDNDGLTPAANVSFVTDGWVGRANPDDASDNSVVSTSWYDPAGASDDWLITPAININQAGLSLKWNAKAQDGSFADGYEVLLSTTGTAIADFTTTLYSTAGENDAWTTRIADLSAYNGQTVHIAFRNNSSDKFLLYLDDIEVVSIPQYDVAGVSTEQGAAYGFKTALAPAYGLNNAPISLGGTFSNNGAATITSVEMSYSIDGGAAVTANVTGLSIDPSGTFEIAHPTAWTPAATGNYNVEIWVSAINGNADGNTANDKVSGSTTIHTQSADRISLVELFSSSTCPPCAGWNTNVYTPFFDDKDANDESISQLSVVKNQVPIPSAGDPSQCADSDVRRQYYGISSAPSSVINGFAWDPFSLNLASWGDASGYLADAINAADAMPSFINIDAEFEYDSVNVNVMVDVESTIDLTGNYTVQIEVLNKHYTYTGASNGDTEYHHVMRKMLPDANGTSVNGFTAGTPVSVNESYQVTIGTPAATNFNLWNEDIEVVVFVQNETTKEVVQSTSAVFKAKGPNVGINEVLAENSVAVYPNPASNLVNVNFNLAQSSEVEMRIYDVTGKVVLSEVNSFANGTNSAILNIESLTNGVYYVDVVSGHSKTTKRLVISK